MRTAPAEAKPGAADAQPYVDLFSIHDMQMSSSISSEYKTEPVSQLLNRLLTSAAAALQELRKFPPQNSAYTMGRRLVASLPHIKPS